MRKILNVLMLVLATVFCTSCLEGGLEDLPLAGDADIISVRAVSHRWISSDKEPSSGENKEKQASLTQKNTVDKENCSVTIQVSIPDGFPQDQITAVSVSKLVVDLNVSSAARVYPENGSAALGKPADWSKPNQYRIQAANGTEKLWTVTLTMAK